DACGAGNNASLIEQIAKRNTFPYSIADQARIQTVADAHERCLLRGWLESFKILKAPCRRVLHEANDFEMPYIDVYFRIDDVFGDAVEQVVRRNRLNNAAFIFRAVIAECCDAIQFPRQRSSTASRCETDRSQHECTPSDAGGEFFGTDSALRCVAAATPL